MGQGMQGQPGKPEYTLGQRNEESMDFVRLFMQQGPQAFLQLEFLFEIGHEDFNPWVLWTLMGVFAISILFNAHNNLRAVYNMNAVAAERRRWPSRAGPKRPAVVGYMSVPVVEGQYGRPPSAEVPISAGTPLSYVPEPVNSY